MTSDLENLRAQDEYLCWTFRRGSWWVKRMTEDWQTPTEEEWELHRRLAAPTEEERHEPR